ncbi:MAG: BrnT family toxin [Treponema sp.]|nr:BrnT family toxin [Treponema sp.]
MQSTDVEWDDDKNEINKREHEGLGFELAQLVFADPNRLVLRESIGVKITHPEKSVGKPWV